jgi:hypothetical protein
MVAVNMTTTAGNGVTRIDGRLKVTGEARYGSDRLPADTAFACLVTSVIARGRIVGIDDGEVRALPGVIDILTHQNIGRDVKPSKFFSAGGYMSSSIMPLGSGQVWHAGQIVALVVANTFETAQDGARRLRVRYDEQPPSAGFDSPGATEEAAKDADPKHEDPEVGDAAAAFDAAPVKIDARYATPTQHHNPIELFTTVCAWADGALTVWESSQNVYGFKNGLADQLGLDPDRVRVISPYIGGAFGSRGSLTQRTALVAVAARRLGRPVKLVATRAEGFTIATYRAETRHHVKLAADRDGKLQALVHEGWEVSSRPDPYKVAGTDASTRIYACPNVTSKVTIVHADRNTPGFMRSPPEVPYLFAMESAMGRAGGRAAARSRRAQAPERHAARADQGSALYQPQSDAVLRRRGEGLRLGGAQPDARLDARWRLGHRLGLRYHHVPDAARAGDGARQLVAARLRQGSDRGARHRQRRLYRRRHDSGRGARRAARPRLGRAGRFRPAAGAGGRRLQHHGQRLQRRRQGLRRDPRAHRARRRRGS